MTALVLIWGPLYAFLTIVLVVGLHKLTNRKWPSGIALALAIGWPVVDLMQTHLVLSGYCDDWKRGRVYEVVENVEGIFVAHNQGCNGQCFYAIRAADKHRYTFAEARAGNFQDTYRETAAEQYEKAFVPGPGLYRFTVEKTGHPNCKIYDRWFAKMKGLHSNPNYFGNCIATVPIDHISAEYAINSYDKTKTFGPNKLYVVTDEARRIADNTLVFERRNHVLSSSRMWSQFFNPFSCDRDGPLLTYRDALISSSAPLSK